MKVDLKELITAFQKWEDGFRTNPEEFFSHEEAAEMQVSELSVKCGEYFMQLLKEGKN